jgi:ABC-type molybdate transport system permease subunit
MPPDEDQVKKKKLQHTYNLTLAAVTGQVGCLTLIIILAALFGGLWLDNRFDTRPMFTIGLVIASVPVTLFLMIWVAKKATAKINRDQVNSDN